MHIESVEIFSDATNAAIMRHPGRRFPGILIQGDTLYSLCREADEACEAASLVLSEEQYIGLNDLRTLLREYLTHYKTTLIAHGLPLPFNEIP